MRTVLLECAAIFEDADRESALEIPAAVHQTVKHSLHVQRELRAFREGLLQRAPAAASTRGQHTDAETHQSVQQL